MGEIRELASVSGENKIVLASSWVTAGVAMSATVSFLVLGLDTRV